MTIEQTLSLNGLPEREAKVYLALLELGQASVLQVSRRSGIERTYCYDVLESLIRQGLASRLEIAGKARFLAEPPDAVAAVFERRVGAFRQALPELRSRHNTGSQKPVVRFYEGRESLQAIYAELGKCPQYDAISSPSSLYKALGKEVDRLASALVGRGTRARELVSAEMGMPGYGRIFKKPLQEVRLLPKSVILATDTLIYEDKVASVSWLPRVHVVITEGSGIVGTQRALFEYMWNMTGETR